MCFLLIWGKQAATQLPHCVLCCCANAHARVSKRREPHSDKAHCCFHYPTVRVCFPRTCRSRVTCEKLNCIRNRLWSGPWYPSAANGRERGRVRESCRESHAYFDVLECCWMPNASDALVIASPSRRVFIDIFWTFLFCSENIGFIVLHYLRTWQHQFNLVLAIDNDCE